MELKEFITYAKKWTFPVLLLALGVAIGSFFLAKKLQEDSIQKSYTSSGKIEQPNDNFRIISYGSSRSSKRVIIDNETEMANIASQANIESSVRYYTLLEAVLNQSENAHAEEPETTAPLTDPLDVSTSESFQSNPFESDNYRKALKKLEMLAGQIHEDESLYFPKTYWPQDALELANQEGQSKGFQALLSRERSKELQGYLKNITIETIEGRIVELKFEQAPSEKAAQLWVDALLLAAKKESFHRLVLEFNNSIQLENQRIEAMRMPLSPEIHGHLIDLAVQRVESIENHAEALYQEHLNKAQGIESKKSSDEKSHEFVPKTVFFSGPQALQERLAYYGKIEDIIETSYSTISHDEAFRGSMVVYEGELANLRSQRNDINRMLMNSRSKENNLKLEQTKLKAEKERFSLLQRTGRVQEYQFPEYLSTTYTNVRDAKREMNRLKEERLQLGLQFTEEHNKMKENAEKLRIQTNIYAESIESAFPEHIALLQKTIQEHQSQQLGYEQKRDALIEEQINIQIRQIDKLGALANLYSDAKEKVQEAYETIDKAEDYRDSIRTSRSEQSPVLKIFQFSQGAQDSTSVSTGPLQVALVMGIIVIIGSSVLLYVFTLARNKIETEYDVRRHVNLPVLAKLAKWQPEERSLLNVSLRNSVAEAFNTLATLTRSYAKELSLRSILITSAVMEEGKTNISCNLAIALARKGLRVLIVDADLHRASVGKFFGLGNEPTGIIQYSQAPEGERRLQDYVTPTSAEGVDVLLPGGEVTDPVRVLESKAFRSLEKEAEDNYDLVIYDSPPVARVGDALIMASDLDATMVVVSSGDVTYADAAYAKRLLTNVQANILGVILNNSKDARAREYYNYYGYGDKRQRRVRKVLD